MESKWEVQDHRHLLRSAEWGKTKAKKSKRNAQNV